MTKLMVMKIEVLSVFPSSQVYVMSIVTYGARRLCSEEEKNEISIDDYLLNNTLLSFFSPLCERVCWCARCRCRRRTGLNDDGVGSSSMVVVDLLLFFFISSYIFYDDYSYSYHQNNDIIILITTIILNFVKKEIEVNRIIMQMTIS